MIVPTHLPNSAGDMPDGVRTLERVPVRGKSVQPASNEALRSPGILSHPLTITVLTLQLN